MGITFAPAGFPAHRCIKRRERNLLAMTHWLAVTTAENWARCAATKTWGVTDRSANLLKGAQVDDDLLVYVVGMKCAGIFRVAKPYFFDTNPIWADDIYPHRILFDPALTRAEPVDIKQFYYSFFPSLSPAGYFRTPFRELPDDEFELFREFLERGKVHTLEVTPPPPPEAEFALSLERDLEDYLETNLQVIEPGLRPYREGEIKGRQFGTDVSRIDLLGQDASGNFVIIELKAGEADRTVLGQILPYMGWVREHLAGGKAVRGVVVASDFSQDVLSATRVLSNFSLYKYSVQFSFRKVAPEVPMSR